jgi:DNA gyrase subunit A
MDVGTVERVDIDETMRSAYLSYAMSVISARALPDVRDGLKPVQRRILYAMHDMGMTYDHPTRKSARIVGEVLGKYHPHGDSAVYDAMVRMAQDFSMRCPLVDGQGNFGSVDGDGAAAMRYTEARLSLVGGELLVDLDKDTVDFIDNFDGSLQEPKVLPAKLPNLLVNGVSGIAVGMATNIPPHNLGEIADAIAYLIDHYSKVDDVTVEDLMRFVQGPDFPTGGTILGREGIQQAYATGKGRVVVRAQAHVENLRGGHSAIIVTELPYQVNKATLVARIADLVRNGRIQGIGDLRDESDRTGMRVVVELKRGVEAGPILSLLLKHTSMQTTFGVNMLALVDGEPRTLSLKRVLQHYVEHRQEVLVRRTRYELEKARARAHVLEGLLLALDNLDEVIRTIRRSRTADTARRNLCRNFDLTEIQARAILDMQLRRLAALERQRIEEEHRELVERIKYLRSLLVGKKKILALIKQDVLDLKKAYGDPRRTRVIDATASTDLQLEDLVPDGEAVLLVTRKGYARRLPTAALRGRRKGIVGMSSREKDVVRALFVANMQDTAMFFTNKGRVANLPVHQLPDASQQESGLLLSNLVRLGDGEYAVAVLHVGKIKDDDFVCMATRLGKVKRLPLDDVATLGRGPVQVIGLADGDDLRSAVLAHEADEVVMVTAQGKAIRFALGTVRPQGLSASGVRGISLKDDDTVASMDVVRKNGWLAVATALGYAKRTSLRQYSTQGRAGQGSLAMDVSKIGGTGPIVAARVVLPEEEVIFTTVGGAMVRMLVRGIPTVARASWGRLVTRTRRLAAVQLENDDRVDSVLRLDLSTGDGGGQVEAKVPPRKRTRTSISAPATKATAPKRSIRSKRTAATGKDVKAGSTVTPKPPRKRVTKASVSEKPTQVEAEPETPEPTRARSRRTRRAMTTKTPRRTRSSK